MKIKVNNKVNHYFKFCFSDSIEIGMCSMIACFWIVVIITVWMVSIIVDNIVSWIILLKDYAFVVLCLSDVGILLMNVVDGGLCSLMVVMGLLFGSEVRHSSVSRGFVAAISHEFSELLWWFFKKTKYKVM